MPVLEICVCQDFFSISLVIFIGLKLFIIFLYYSLAFIQYFMSHLFLILVFYVFSFFHLINLVKSISFDLFKKRSFGSLILLSVHLLFYLFLFCFIYFTFIIAIFLLCGTYFLFFSHSLRWKFTLFTRDLFSFLQ